MIVSARHQYTVRRRESCPLQEAPSRKAGKLEEQPSMKLQMLIL